MRQYLWIYVMGGHFYTPHHKTVKRSTLQTTTHVSLVYNDTDCPM